MKTRFDMVNHDHDLKIVETKLLAFESLDFWYF